MSWDRPRRWGGRTLSRWLAPIVVTDDDGRFVPATPVFALIAQALVRISPRSTSRGASGSSVGSVNGRDIPLDEYQRQYQMLYGDKQQQLHAFMKDVAIPAFNRHGIGPVGAFQVVYGQNQPSLYVLLPHAGPASVLALRRSLADDADYLQAGAAFLEPPLADPAFVRVESSLLVAFAGMPKLEVPAQTAEGRSRIFELRIYESHSEPAARRKVQMFDEGGEIAIFRKTGLTPVFFAETLVGPRLPNLQYLLAFDDLAARDVDASQFGEVNARPGLLLAVAVELPEVAVAGDEPPVGVVDHDRLGDSLQRFAEERAVTGRVELLAQGTALGAQVFQGAAVGSVGVPLRGGNRHAPRHCLFLVPAISYK